MCCYQSSEVKKWLLNNTFKRRKTARFLKVLDCAGRSPYAKMTFGPGKHVATTTKNTPIKRYNSNNPRGFHVHMNADIIRFGLAGVRIGNQILTHINDVTEVVIPITCHVNDLIAADINQAVFSQINISEKDWNEAFTQIKPEKKWNETCLKYTFFRMRWESIQTSEQQRNIMTNPKYNRKPLRLRPKNGH
jgi:hypothetical protein